MKFEGSTSLHPRIPKGLLINDNKPKGPFAIRYNAKEIAKQIGYDAIVVPTGYGQSYYVVPKGMNEDFQFGKMRDKQNNPVYLGDE